MMRFLSILATICNDKSGNLYQAGSLECENKSNKRVHANCMYFSSVLCISLLQMCFELFKHNKYKMVTKIALIIQTHFLTKSRKSKCLDSS